MLKLFRHGQCRTCDTFEAELRARCLAYEATFAEPDSYLHELPAVEDFGRLYQGADELELYLHEIEDFKLQWEKFQSDSCYCGDDGDVI